MSNKAEVRIGGYLADMHLLPEGSVLITISGMRMTEKLFESFVQSQPRFEFVSFDRRI